MYTFINIIINFMKGLKMDSPKQKILLNKRQRNSSIELLRIITMIMIVFHHFAYHGNFKWDINELTIPHFWYDYIIMGGKIGVNVFILISGYFLINNNTSIFNFKKIAKMWGEIFFYSISINILFTILGVNTFGIKSLIKACFPITLNSWWFASAYFVLYLMHPFINILLNAFDQKTYQSFLFMLIICWSIIPTITSHGYQGNNLLWFMTLYSISGYTRKFGLNNKFKAKHYLLLWAILSILTYSTSLISAVLGTKIEFFSNHSTYFYNQNNILILLISFTFFMIFASLKIKHSKIINTISSATFGVYLIHDNEIIRHFLWSNVFKNSQLQHSDMLLPYSIIVVILVYTVCTIIDLIRQRIFETRYINLIDKYSEKLLEPFQQLCNWCKSVIFGNK